MAPAPVVNGISPKEGPPGTRVTIRGQHLGKTPNDLIGLTICGSDCLLSAEWKSPNKVIARSGPGKGRGEIIVVTGSGGIGTSLVQFRGYHETIGPLKESAVWVEEASLNTLTWGHRSLSPSSYQLEDPLGLSVEENEKKFPEEDLHELFPECSGDLSSENFEPGWFLLEHHHATSFDDLRVGLSFLRRKVEGQKEGQISFLKSNIGSVMEQLDTLFILKEKFEADLKARDIDPTIKVEKAIEESISEAEKLFHDVLARREKADATRNALNVMQRFKFLFYLPGSIERNVKKGEIDVVINDYDRALNLFGKTDVAVFKKVLAEVELKISELREMLWKKLEDMSIGLDQQKKTIRNLVNLEIADDPGWKAITVHSNFLNEQLIACKTEHLKAESADMDGSSKHLDSHHKHKHKRAASGTYNVELLNRTPQPVLCVEELTEILSQRFPDLWKLGQSYFSGEFQIKIDPGRPQEFKGIVLSIISLVCTLLRSALLPHTVDKNQQWPQHHKTSDSVSTWLPHCLRYIRAAYSTLIALDLPSDALNIFSSLVFDLRLHCMSTLLCQAAEQIKTLGLKENWQIEFDQNGGITQLPSMFENLVAEVMQLVKDSVIIAEQRETPLLDNPAAKKDLNRLVLKLLLNFVEALDNLGLTNEDGDHTLGVSQLIGSSSQSRDKDSFGAVYEQKLLCTLSNCRHTRLTIFPRFINLFERHGFPRLSEPFEEAEMAFKHLEKRILDTYIEQKSDPLVGTIEPSMYIGNFDWDTCLPPTDIRPYAKEIIFSNIITVHSEVYKVIPSLVYPVISQIVEIVAEELSRLMSCVTKFSIAGNQQARIDLMAIQQTLQHFSTKNAVLYFNEALETIPPLDDPFDLKVVDEVLKKFTTRNKLQLKCFNNPS